MSSTNKDMKKLGDDIARYNALLDEQERIKDDLAELKKEIKLRKDEQGYDGMEVARLAKTKRAEAKVREKVASLQSDLDTLAFFADIGKKTKKDV